MLKQFTCSVAAYSTSCGKTDNKKDTVTLEKNRGEEIICHKLGVQPHQGYIFQTCPCPCHCYIFQLLSQLSAFPGLAGMGMYGLPGTGLPATGTGLQGYSSFNAVNPTNSTDQQLQALNNYAALSAAG